MKTGFYELMDQTEAAMLEESFDSLQEEKVPSDTLSRIQKRVTGTSGKKNGKAKKWVPAAVAACAALALGIAWGSGAFKQITPSSRPGDAPLQQTGTPLQLTGVPETEDRFAADPALGDGSFSDAAMDRMVYTGIRFYESKGSIYMFHHEYSPVYRYENGSFVKTQTRPAEQQFFSTGTYEGYAYVGGVFHCVGGNESGLFRVDLATGEVEKYIDCREIVSSVAVSGNRIYYSTRTSDLSWEAVYSLKCADVESRRITRLLSDVPFAIRDLRIEGDALYFSSSDGVRYIRSDMTLGLIGTGNVSSYTVCDGAVYICGTAWDEETPDRICTVSGYDGQGNPLGSVSIRQRFGENGGSKDNRYYMGSPQDGLTVYDGRVVLFDAKGVYLQDIATGEEEKILDYPFRAFDPDNTSKTVYDGKLFLCLHDTLILYDGEKATRTELN